MTDSPARTVCGRTPTDQHPVDGFCARCLHRTRSDLNTVANLYALLPAELTGHGAAATPPDPSGVRGGSDYLVDAWVLYAPGTIGSVVASRLGDRSHAADQLESDPISTPAMLSGWEDVWRAILGLPAAGTQRNGHKWRDIYPCIVNVTATVQFIQQNLTRLARHALFAEMAIDLRDQRTWLERATRTGDIIERGVPCTNCGEQLTRRYRPPAPCEHSGPHCDHTDLDPRRWPCRGSNTCVCDQGGRANVWRCENRDCGLTFDDTAYALAMYNHWLALESGRAEQAVG